MFENLLKSASLSSHPRLGNLNKTWYASLPGFFPKILISVFQSIYMGLGNKLFLQLFLIVYFAVESEKYKSRDFIQSHVIAYMISWIFIFFQVIIRKSSLMAEIFLRILSKPFSKSKKPLGYPKILMAVNLIII